MAAPRLLAQPTSTDLECAERSCSPLVASPPDARQWSAWGSGTWAAPPVGGSGSTLPASGPARVLIEADVEDLNAGNSAVGLDPGGLQDPVVLRAGEVSDD